MLNNGDLNFLRFLILFKQFIEYLEHPVFTDKTIGLGLGAGGWG